jgi:hypothetical protein
VSFSLTIIACRSYIDNLPAKLHHQGLCLAGQSVSNQRIQLLLSPLLGTDSLACVLPPNTGHRSPARQHGTNSSARDKFVSKRQIHHRHQFQPTCTTLSQKCITAQGQSVALQGHPHLKTSVRCQSSVTTRTAVTVGYCHISTTRWRTCKTKSQPQTHQQLGQGLTM